MKRLAFAFACVALLISGNPGRAQDAGAVQRGEYLFNVAGCAGCHTTVQGQQRGPLAAGGRPLATPFGTFYGPNITSDPTHGIGRWSEADFIRALRDGVRPDGAHYFPAFPFTSFTRMTDADMRSLFAYVRTIPAVAQPSRPHDVSFPFNIRFLQFFWKLIFFTRGPFQADPARSAEINRGAYLAEALSHCQECHTPRNFLGGLRGSMAYAGTRDGPEGGRVPNVTPDRATGIGGWAAGDLEEFLASGLTPDGDSAGGAMGEVISSSTGRMTAEDRRALVAYMRSLRPVENNLRQRPGS
ncbi:MAG: c-type cytochrome [Alphaproteobacteria bacterium]|nr:c-type cytochrome [Alphaproteobacteria bacterium]